MRISTIVLATAAALAGVGMVSLASAQTLGAAFTYQGTFADAGVPASGNYDFEFALFTVGSGGTAVQTVTKTGVAVSGGLINTSIDFEHKPTTARSNGSRCMCVQQVAEATPR